MKQITDQEFEEYIREMIEGKKTRRQVVDELETEHRTLYNKIELLSATNPELYQEYIKQYPFTPRERKDVNAVELAIEILKEKMTIQQIAQKYGIGERTLRRKIHSLNNPKDHFQAELYTLCKTISHNHSCSITNSAELNKRVQEVLEKFGEQETEDIRISNVEIKRQELLEIEKQYNELCLRMSKKEAAKQMGYTSNRIYKLLNELYRIEIELQTKGKSEFRQGLKIETETIKVSPEISTAEQKIEQDMDKEKE